MKLLTPVEKTTVEVGETEYSLAAQHTVARLLLERMSTPIPPNGHNVAELIERLRPWYPVTRAGRITKRLSKEVKEMGCGIPEATLATIGNYLAGDLPSDSIVYDIVNDFDWQQGAYGDAGSCFFFHGGAEMKRLTMSAAKAIRFYNKGGMGSGRAIVLPLPTGEDCVVVNTYGQNIAQLLSRLKLIVPDLYIKRVQVMNNSKLYINLQQGILCSKHEYEYGKVSLDFHLPELPRPEPSLSRHRQMAQCAHCLVEHIANTMAVVPAGRTTRHMLCQPCLEELAREGELLYSPYTKQYHYQSDLSLRTVVVPTAERTSNDLTNNRVHAPQEMLVPYWIYDTMRTCTLCTNKTATTCMVSIDGVRHDSVCYACVGTNGIDSYCRYCNAYKKRRSICYCSPARKEAKNVNSNESGPTTPDPAPGGEQPAAPAFPTYISGGTLTARSLYSFTNTTASSVWGGDTIRNTWQDEYDREVRRLIERTRRTEWLEDLNTPLGTPTYREEVAADLPPTPDPVLHITHAEGDDAGLREIHVTGDILPERTIEWDDDVDIIERDDDDLRI